MAVRALIMCYVVVSVMFDGVTSICVHNKDCPDQQVCCKPSDLKVNICEDNCIGLVCDYDSDCGGKYCCDNTCQNSSCNGLRGWAIVLIVFLCILVVCLIVGCVKMCICQHPYFVRSTIIVTDSMPLTASQNTSYSATHDRGQVGYYNFNPSAHEPCTADSDDRPPEYYESAKRLNSEA